MSYSTTITTSFSGISQLSSYPPHNGLAVGMDYIVMAEGSLIEWTNLSGGAATTESLYQLFQPLGATATNALFDPRCAYDSVNHRYIVTVDNIGSNGTISNIDIAVSKDSNPNDGWYLASLNTAISINGQLTDADQPTVSVDGTNIYITTPQYNDSGGGWQGTECWVIGDSAGAGGGIYNGGTLTVVGNQVAPPGQNIFRVVAGSNGKSYYAAAYSTGSQTVVTVQTYDLATNTFGPASTLALGNGDQGGGGANFTAQQQGTTLLLDAGDTNIQNLAYANGFLYGVSEVKPAGSSVPEVHWFKMDVSNPSSPTLVAQGDISGAAIGANVATFDGSIAVDGAGDVLINFTASGPNMYPSAYYVFQGSTDPPGSFSAPILYQASTSFFDSGDGAAVQPWGSNSSTTADPSNPHAFWLSGEYVANGWWQTSVTQVTVQTPADARTDEDTPVSGSLAPLAPAGSTFTAGTFKSADGAAVTIAANGNYTYDPTGAAAFEALQIGQPTVDRFTYTVIDANNVSSTATMLVDVTVSDSGPVVQNFRSTSQTQASFSGISDTSDDPPDNGLAVGPNNVVMAEGQSVEWTDLSGGAATLQSAYTFFGDTIGSVKDTSCVYDSANNCYIVTSENQVPVSGGYTSNLQFAVSKDANPNDGWNFTSINSSITINNSVTVSDEPTVSADGTNIYIATPQYNSSAPGWQGTELWVISDKAGSGGGLYNGGTPTIVASQTTSPNQGIFRVVAGNNGKAYYACIYNPGSQSTVALQIYDAATNTFAPVSTISLGNIDQGNGGSDFTAQQQGTNVLLDVNDGRIANLVYSNGFLYGVSEMKPFGSSVPQVHWFKIDVSNPGSPTLVAQGNISGNVIGPGVATFDGSIAVDGSGDVIINFTASGPNMYPADYYVFHGATDPANSFSAPVLYQSSASFFADPAMGSGPQRWGANSSAIPDPNNPHGFWLSSEYIANGWWQTAVTQVAIATPITISTGRDAPLSASLTSLVTAAEPTDSGDTLSFTAGTFTSTDGAKVMIAANGSYTYDPTGVAAFAPLQPGQSATDSFTYTVTDNHAATAAGLVTVNVTGPTQPHVASVAASPSIGDEGVGRLVAITLNMSEAVTVTGGAPTLALNDGGSASYDAAKSSTTSLVFDYTVASGQNTPTLAVTGIALNGATVQNASGIAANFSGANASFAGLQIDTTPPVVTITSTGGAVNQAAQTVAGTVDVADAGTTVTVLDGTTQAATAIVQANGSWSAGVTLAAGPNTLTAQDTDPAGNTGVSNAVTYTLNTTAPVVSAIATSGAGITNGNGDLNAGKAVTLTVGFSEAVTVNTAGGSPTLALNDGGSATYAGGSGTSALAFGYTVLSGQNTPDLVVASFALNGATIQDAATNNADLSGAANYNPPGILQIDTTAPTIAINTIASNNIINATKASAGFAISGTSTDAENGQIVTVNVVNSSNTVVDSYTATDQSNAWSVRVTSAQATALADGSYLVTANVADKAGNAAPQATHALTVDEEKVTEAPSLDLANTSLTVSPGGSVPLGITATPVDSDDSLSVTIAGVPKYETITAPTGDTVTRHLQSNGTYTWTVTETSSTAGKPLGGLTLASSYKGSGHPTATLTVTARDTTSGETAASPSQTLAVTDPPIASSTPLVAHAPQDQQPAAAPGGSVEDQLTALLNEFRTAGFDRNPWSGGTLDRSGPAFGRNFWPGAAADAALGAAKGMSGIDSALLANNWAATFTVSGGPAGAFVTDPPIAATALLTTLLHA